MSPLHDQAIMKVAGVIYWKMQRGDDAPAAMAFAHQREPELTDSEIRQALRWALAQQSLQRECSCKECGGAYVKSPGQPLCCGKCGATPKPRLFREALDSAGVPWREE